MVEQLAFQFGLLDLLTARQANPLGHEELPPPSSKPHSAQRGVRSLNRFAEASFSPKDLL
jgi:hypothetical protein